MGNFIVFMVLAAVALGAAMVVVQVSLETLVSSALQSSFHGYFALGFAGMAQRACELEDEDSQGDG